MIKLGDHVSMKKTIINYIIIFLCAILGGSILLALAYTLPLSSVDKHIQESLIIFEKEGDYPREIAKNEATRRDNFTDALMLNIASYRGDKSLIEKAFGNYYVTTSDDTAGGWLANRNSESRNEISYARYWHGYVVVLKILLQFMNYQEIRWIIYMVDLTLIILIALYLQRVGKLKYLAPFLIVLMFFPLMTVSKSLQFSTVFIPTLAGIMVLLKDKQNVRQTYDRLFLVEGIIIAYLDLLTYPLVNVGFLLCFALIVDESSHWIEKIKKTLINTILWFVGYAGMWASKWLISSFLLKRNVLTDAMEAASIRMSSNSADSSWTYGEVVKRNIEHCPDIIIPVCIIFVLYIIVRIFRNGIELQSIKNSVSYIIIAIMPFAWYFVLKNHSQIHAFFTHRELAVAYLAVLFFFTAIVSEKRTLSKKNKTN